MEYVLPALPGRTFQGEITLVEPILDEATRALKVRVETPNPSGELKPGMYARATVKATPGTGEARIVIPATAVLWTGRRSIVYTRRGGEESPSFLPREVELGPSLGDAYVVLSGLTPGEEIVTRGVFAIDASAQLEGKQSMMNDDDRAGAATLATVVLDVQGACDMCRERIEGIALGTRGVHHASWDAGTRKLRLHHDPLIAPVDAIARAIAAAGHDAGEYTAPLAAYDALPPCCKYRE